MRLGYITLLIFFPSVFLANTCVSEVTYRPMAPTLCVGECDPSPALGSLTSENLPKNVQDSSSFHPGHWLKVADPSPSYMAYLMEKLEGTNIRGIEIWHRWDRLEPASAGDYTGKYWEQLENWITEAESKGLSILIRIRTHMFRAGGDPYTPDYMKHDDKYGGSASFFGSYCSTSSCELRPAWHDSDTVARAQALIDEIARRWGGRDNFEGIGLQESAPGQNASKTPRWNGTSHANGIVSIVSYARNVMPNKTAIPNINWHPKMSYLLSELASEGIGLGCPDLPSNGSIPHAAVSAQMRSRSENEDHSPGVSGAAAGTLVPGESLQKVYDNATNNLKAWRLVWDDDWLGEGEGLIAFAKKNELTTANAFYNP